MKSYMEKFLSPGLHGVLDKANNFPTLSPVRDSKKRRFWWFAFSIYCTRLKWFLSGFILRRSITGKPTFKVSKRSGKAVPAVRVFNSSTEYCGPSFAVSSDTTFSALGTVVASPKNRTPSILQRICKETVLVVIVALLLSHSLLVCFSLMFS